MTMTTKRETIKRLVDRWERATVVTDNRLEELRDEVRPLLEIMGIRHVCIDSVSMGHDSLFVEYSWSCRGCDDSSATDIPYSVVDAPDPVQAIADIKKAKEGQDKQAQREHDLREFERLQAKLKEPA